MKSFCELGPKLIRQSGCYLLTEVFCQDPLERYFSKQRHRGGGNDNPTVEQFRHNSAILHHRQLIGCELKTMNVYLNRWMLMQLMTTLSHYQNGIEKNRDIFVCLLTGNGKSCYCLLPKTFDYLRHTQDSSLGRAGN